MRDQYPGVGLAVGRIIHYSDHARPCNAAIVTQAQEGETIITLTVFLPTHSRVVGAVPHDDGRAPGTWHWPERV